MKGKRPVVIFKNKSSYYLFKCYCKVCNAIGMAVNYPWWARKSSVLIWEKVEK